MGDLAWMLVPQAALLWMLGSLLPGPGTKNRSRVERAGFRVPHSSGPAPGIGNALVRPAAALLSEETARRMIESAYASTAHGESGGTGY
jgi:hypothetical protein